MRESLTIFAIAVIIVLSALLVGPYFVDWSGQRDWLAAKLSNAIGAEIHIDGPVDVRLLPRPIFRAGRVSIGSREPHEPHFSAERLDAELSLNGLLQGAVDFVDARLTAPRVELTVRRDGTLVGSPISIASPQKIQFGKLTIGDGTLAILDEDGHERLSMHDIAAEGQAETLLGPLKLAGSAADGQGRANFRLTTGAYANRKLRTRIVIDRKGPWTHADAEGQLALAPQTAKDTHSAGITYVGNLNLAGAVQVAPATSPVPWTLVAAALTADPRNLAAPAVELRAGADGRSLVANGGALVDFGAVPSAAIKMHARQLDLDTLAVPPEVAPDTPRPTGAQWLAAVKQLLEDGGLPRSRLAADVGIDAVTRGDLTLTDASFKLDRQPGQDPRVAMTIKGPDESRVTADGALAAGAAPSFKGTANLSTRRLGTVAGWLDPIWPGLADWVGNGLADRAVAFAGNVDVSSAGFAARDANLTLGGTTLTGLVSYTAPVASERPRLVADVTAEALDPAQWPDLRQLAGLADPLDLGIALRSNAVQLPDRDGAASGSGQLSLHLTKNGKAFALDRFTITGLEGTTVSGSASLGADQLLRASGRATAQNPVPLANLLRQWAPGGVAAALGARAAGLAPLDIGFDAEASLDDGGQLLPRKLSINGTAGTTRFSGSIAPELKGGGTSNVEVNLSLDAPEGVKLLQQAGWSVEGRLGAVHAEARGHGDLATGLDSSVTVIAPGAKAGFNGLIGGDFGKGRLSASGLDAAPLLAIAGIERRLADHPWSATAELSWKDGSVAAHQIVARLNGSAVAGDLDAARPASTEGAPGATLTGTLAVDKSSLATLIGLGFAQARAPDSGRPAVWSTQPFGPPSSLPVSDVALRIGALDVWPGLSVQDGALHMALRAGTVSLNDMTGKALGGTLGGAVTVRHNGSGASVTGKITLDHIALNLPSVSGRLSGAIDVAGTGTNPASLVGSLGGDGKLVVADTILPRLDPGALARVAASFNHDDATVENGPVRDALSAALDRATASLGTVSGPATLAAGTLRFAMPNTPIANARATVSADAAFDLEDVSLALKATLTAMDLPPEWKGDPPQVTVSWKGPLDAPVRDLDAGAFVNGLAARAIAREQDRIELMKDDLRERAFFARRLRQIEAEQQAVRQAAQPPKVVPQPPTRPGDIRLPKPPDVGPPSLAPTKPTQSSQGEDGIAKLLDALTPKSAPARPIELSPPSRPAAQAGPPSQAQDPAAQGRY